MLENDSTPRLHPGDPESRACKVCGHVTPPDSPSGLCPMCIRRDFFCDETEDFPTAPPKAGDRIGDYELISEIARGGMGIVFRARQRSLGRLVAVKLIESRQESSAEFIARFETEARTAASLDHPNVVPVYETGEHDGRYFFAMKLVEGESLAQCLARARRGDAASGRLSAEQGARLLAKVARAVHHAHHRGILHRDLKPSNILLDEQGEPHLTDFGLARLLEGESLVTRSSAAIGTPAYMSPEQAAGGARNLTTASDVFSLGAILYELLSGRPPFLGDTPLETMRKVVEEEPVPFRRESHFQSKWHVERDLETICFKCLAKETVERYSTALALAEDLERWLRHEPIQARAVRQVERVGKWMRRNPKVAALMVMLNVVFAVGLAGILWTSIRLAAKAKESQERLVRMNIATGNRLVDNGEHLSALLWFSEALRLEQGNAEREEIHRYRMDATWRHSPRLSQVFFHEGALANIEFSPDGARLLTASEDQTARIWNVATGEPATPPMRHEAVLGAASWSPDGRAVATMSRDGVTKVWDATSGQMLFSLPAPADFRQVSGRIDPALSFSADGRRFVTAFGSFAARVWDAATGALILTLSHSNVVYDAAFSPDGRFIITGSEDRMARIWDATTGSPTGVVLEHNKFVNRAMFSPDNQRVLTVSDRKWLQIWDGVTGKPLSVPFGHDYVLFDVSFSPDGKWILSAGWDMSARLWDATTGRQIGRMDHAGGLYRACFSPDGRRVAAASFDHVVRVWDTASGKPSTSVLPHGAVANRVTFSPDSRLLATASSDGTVRVWDLSAGDSVIRTFPNDEVIAAEFSPDERYVVTASTGAEHTARVYETASGLLVATPLRHTNVVRQALFSPDSRRLLTASDDGTARLWEVPSGREICPALQHSMPVRYAAFNPNGTRVVTACDDGAARIWDANSGRLLLPPLAHTNVVVRAEFSPDGKLVVTASLDHTARLWNAFTGEPASPPLLHPQPVYVAAFSRDGKRLVTACGGEVGGMQAFAQVWDVATRERRGAPLNHGQIVCHAEFSPDGRRVATASYDGTARVWDAETSQPLPSSIRYGSRVKQARFSPDGRRLATGTAEGILQIWDAATGEAITPQLKQPALHDLMQLRFSADGQRLLIASAGQAATLRYLPKTEWPVEDLRLQAEVLSGYKLDPAAGMVPLPPMELSNSWRALQIKHPTQFPNFWQ